MNHDFWISAWEEGRTAFHRSDFHEKLLQYFPVLKAKPNQNILVPLCGKTKDLLWLSLQRLNVRGVELYEEAAKSFFSENGLPELKIEDAAHFKNYSSGPITISTGDFFALEGNESFDFVYDRASLVALPPDMRKRYAEVITKVLRPEGKCLLIVYDYDQTQMDGPPFSVPESEVQELYGKKFKISLLESEKPKDEGPRLGSVPSLVQKVYLLEKLAR